MLAAPIPEDDIERVATLHALKILDTIPEERFDRITRIVKTVFNVPIALVSLVDANRQWFKSCIGLDVSETPRDISFCGHAIMGSDVFYIPDATKDPRFSDNPIVTGPPFVIFYAGQPLTAKNGKKLGTLCIIDSKPRILSETELQTIRDMGVFAENELNILTLSQALIIQRESEERIREVMDNIKEGIFLLNSNFEIGIKYSKVLESLLNNENLAKQNLFKILEGKISEKSKESLNDYLDLMFQISMDEEMLSELNPLHEIEFQVNSEKYFLNFNFSRVINDSKIEHLVCTVQDITKQTLLSREIKEAEQNAAESLQKLFGIIHVDPNLLKEFIDSTKEELFKVNQVLQNTEQNQLENSIEKLFRAVHSIKGDASLLDIKLFADKAHVFETEISHLRGKAGINGKDLIPFSINLNELETMLMEVENIIQKLLKFQESFGEDKLNSSKLLLKAIKEQIKNLTSNSNISLVLDSKSFDMSNMNYKIQKNLKDILIQLVRNSIAHGIEETDHREKLNKPKIATIKLSSFISNGFYELEYFEDGSGLKLEKIKQKAISLGLYLREEIEKMEIEKIYELIFISGLSTSDKIDMMSGRGVGMDIIKERILELGGNIRINSKENQFISFQIKLPI